jgi:hypothetical protein
MPHPRHKEIHFLFERAFNIEDVEAILALYEPGAVLVAGGTPVTRLPANLPQTFQAQRFPGYHCRGEFPSLTDN